MPTHKTAIIIGITGQDGQYLSEWLLAKGFRVIGVVRDSARAKQKLPEPLSAIPLAEWDMFNQQRITDILSQHRPAELYNLAACSSGAGMYDDPVAIGEINGLAVTRILEAIRMTDAAIRFCQASSREVFGEAQETPQTEKTAVNPRSPYGAAKAYGDAMIRIYRRRYKLFACSAILFNHESPRRGLEFVTRKITHTAVRIKTGLSDELHLGNLDTLRDWCFAGDVVEAMWRMLQHHEPDDYVIAAGETHSVREFCERAFGYLGLDYRTYVREDTSDYRPAEPLVLTGSAEKAKAVLGWSPKVGFTELVRMMVDADVALALAEARR